MTKGMMWRIAVVATAGLLLAVPLPARVVEQWYARGCYPHVQSLVTGMSNLVPFALLDALVVVGLVALVVSVFRTVREGRHSRWRTTGKVLLTLVTAAAALYIVFYGIWGLNYEREPVTARLDFDESRVSAASALALAQQSVAALVRLQQVEPPAEEGPNSRRLMQQLAPAFDAAVRSIGLPGGTRPGRPKVSMLDPYFVRAGVSGMTDPFFLETLVASNLLPVEQPDVIAHEWGHLTGLARESEAAFLGWLTCIHAGDWAEYSGWLELYSRVVRSLDSDQRRRIRAGLPARVVRDFQAIDQRNARDQNRVVGQVAWRTYDAYLKTNRVASGVRNYDEVVRIVLGTRFESGWKPVRR